MPDTWRQSRTPLTRGQSTKLRKRHANTKHLYKNLNYRSTVVVRASCRRPSTTALSSCVETGRTTALLQPAVVHHLNDASSPKQKSGGQSPLQTGSTTKSTEYQGRGLSAPGTISQHTLAKSQNSPGEGLPRANQQGIPLPPESAVTFRNDAMES